MSIHEELITRISIAIKRLESAGSLSPSTVALAVHQGLTDENIEVHVYYASLEHLKHMTRKVLAAKFGEAGKLRIAKKFNWFEQAKRLINLLN